VNFKGSAPVLPTIYLKGAKAPWNGVPPVPARIDLSSVEVPIP
ncbi:uncharacterized protein METZ01_LOCUS491792, partial [marine metagenome]